MRVLQVHNRYRLSGGEDRAVEAEAALIESHGHTVLRHHPVNPTDPVSSAMTLAIAPWNPWSARTVRRIARGDSIDIAHVHNTWFTLSPSVIAAIAAEGIPIIVALHNYRMMCVAGDLIRNGEPCDLCVGASPLAGIRHKCYRDSGTASAVLGATLIVNRMLETWRHVGLFVTPSHFAAARNVEGGIPADRIAVVPPVVDDPGERETSPAESDFVVYSGRLSPEKGVEHLVRAWTRRRSRFRLVIAGAGPLRPELERLADDSVTFAGMLSRDESVGLMRRARAVVVPSIAPETFGLTAAEAMACGTPVIASANGAVAEILGASGWVSAIPGDIDDWADKLETVDDDALVDRHGRLGRHRFEATLGPARTFQALDSAYTRVLGDAGSLYA